MEWRNKFEIGEQVWFVWKGKVVSDIVYRVIMENSVLGLPRFLYELVRRMGEYEEGDLFASETEVRCDNSNT